MVAIGLLAASFAQKSTKSLESTARDVPEGSGRPQSVPKHSQQYDGLTLHFTAASPVVVFLQETTAAEKDQEDEQADVDDATMDPKPAEMDAETTTVKRAQNTKDAHKQLLGYLALIDPDFPTTEDEETGEQQVRDLMHDFVVFVFICIQLTSHYVSCCFSIFVSTYLTLFYLLQAVPSHQNVLVSKLL